MIHVCWHEGADGFTRPTGRSGYSCCALLNQMFDTYDCIHWSTFANLPQEVEGAVVVIQGGNERMRVQEINRDLSTLNWAIVIVIGDEACDFPLEQLDRHPTRKIWYQMPEPERTIADRYIPLGFSRDTARLADKTRLKTLDWFFAGQHTHERRVACTTQLAKLKHGILLKTPGFMQGMPQEEYFATLARTRVVPCPSGPASPDTFRMYEALESGCVPIVDNQTPRYPHKTFWPMLYEGLLPFPLVDDWVHLPDIMEFTLNNFDEISRQCQEWWKAYKIEFNTFLETDIACLTK